LAPSTRFFPFFASSTRFYAPFYFTRLPRFTRSTNLGESALCVAAGKISSRDEFPTKTETTRRIPKQRRTLNGAK
jgi:hypothetical protein